VKNTFYLLLFTLPHPQFQIVCSCFYIVQNMHIMQSVWDCLHTTKFPFKRNY